MSDSFMIPPATPSRLETDVAALRQTSLVITKDIITKWENAFDRLWKEYPGGPTAADRLAELGADAASLLARSERLVTFLLSEIGEDNEELKNRILETLATKPATIVHEDGTVTIDETPDPAE